MNIARKFYVSGLVQGVGYRFFTQRAAAKHQVLGYVRNLKDGRVETLVEGEEDSVKSFHEELLTGPFYARVEMVEEIVIDPTGVYSLFIVEK
ncbi:MAG: acylphosphatase [Acidobacteria bacterium]|nr:acylphosphatase [Acidobacteriota bacterium]